VAEYLADGAKTVVSKVSGSKPPTRTGSGSSTTKSGSSSTSKPSTSK
jgi:hypothetical protein